MLLGGYDVVPSIRTDAIGSDLRAKLERQVMGDMDQFWVWSDKLYGDDDGDSVAEFPVSRVPDARDARLFLSALAAPAYQSGERFGIRNVARPFADDVWPPVGRPLNVSGPFAESAVIAGELISPSHYFMLHGVDIDGRSFSGESSVCS